MVDCSFVDDCKVVGSSEAAEAGNAVDAGIAESKAEGREHLALGLQAVRARNKHTKLCCDLNCVVRCHVDSCDLFIVLFVFTAIFLIYSDTICTAFFCKSF